MPFFAQMKGEAVPAANPGDEVAIPVPMYLGLDVRRLDLESELNRPRVLLERACATTRVQPPPRAASKLYQTKKHPD